LGARGWQQVKDKYFHDFASFKKEVELVFGLTKEQMEEKFFAMAPGPGETDASFILRVETERRR
jgi:hypothetical protein